jgi:hypothetical protein
MHMQHNHVPHPEELKRGKTGVQHLNQKIATDMGKVLGNMGFFYFCVILDIAELPSVIKAGSAIAWVSYISQTVIQLLALPVLQVFQNIQEEHNQAKADADHKALVYLAQLQDEQMQILRELKEGK